MTTTYAVRGARTKTTGHIRVPGSRDLYCGKPAGAPNDYARGMARFKMCRPCVTGEQRARAAAEDTANQHRATPDPLTEWRAALAYGSTVYDPERRQAGMVINPRKTVRLPEGGSVRGALVEFPHGYVTRAPLTALFPVPATAPTVEEQPATPAATRRAALDRIKAARTTTPATAPAEGTWHAEWIGEAATTGTLFTLAPDEQGALFA
ncbi:hypothetical protein ACWDN6_14590 [Streptomyces albogriseolus]